jgi:hypothetical protein
MLEDQPMEAVVQWVRTSWTKRSRGEPGAARRNAAPAAFRCRPCGHRSCTRSTWANTMASSLTSRFTRACPAPGWTPACSSKRTTASSGSSSR